MKNLRLSLVVFSLFGGVQSYADLPIQGTLTPDQLVSSVAPTEEEIKPLQVLTAPFEPNDTKTTVEFLPYRAEYSIKHEKQDANSGIKDIQGRLTVQLRDTGDGWTFEQRSELLVYNVADFSDQYITTIASWESKDGQRYRFHVRTLRNGATEEFMQGEGYISPSASGTVTYKEPTLKHVSLPVGTLFPLQHLKQALTAAINGETVFPNKTVFDGSSDVPAPVEIDVVMKPISNPNLIVNNPQLLSVSKMWSLQMAVFSGDNKDPDPDYTITQDVLPSGIITSMIMAYGEAGFSVKLILEKVDVLT